MNPTEAHNAIVGILEYRLAVPNVAELVEKKHVVPKRILKGWSELTEGYHYDIEEIFTKFESGYDEIVAVQNIEFYSLCEHHMLPFFGKAHIGYVPQGKIVGLSKIARVVDTYARRLQVQERLTIEIADCLEKYLEPQGVICVMEAKHLCMMARGIAKQESFLITSAIRGVFKKPEVRQEFFSLLRR